MYAALQDRTDGKKGDAPSQTQMLGQSVFPTGDLVERQSDYDEYAFAGEFYDFVVPYRERKDVGFFVEMALEAAGPVLEIGCGTGRVLIPTARAGVEIVGMDSSSKMLAVCRRSWNSNPK